MSAFIPHCKLKKKCKAGPREKLFGCAAPGCIGNIHFSCSKLLMDHYSIKIDKKLKLNFCTKGCHTKWQADQNKAARIAAAAEKEAIKGKKKVPWDADGTFQVLMDWLTTEGNYSMCCGGNGNKGISKKGYQKIIALHIKDELPDSNRTEKDVENKITTLERQFREAYDWSVNTGQGVDDPGDFEAAVLKRCAVFRELEPVMLDKHNAGPLATNEDHLKPTYMVQELMADLSEDEDCKMPPLPRLSVLPNVAAEMAAQSPTIFLAGAEPAQPTTFMAGHKARPNPFKKKRLTAPPKKEGSKKAKPKDSADDLVTSLFGSEGMQAVRSREAAAKEMETLAKDMVAKADVLKIQKETELIAQQAIIVKLEARASLLEKGVPQEDIDRMLPLE